MDYKWILTMMLIGHFLGDFYFQSQTMADEKDKDRKLMFWHGVIYLVAVGVLVVPFFSMNWIGWLCFLTVPVSHIVFDVAKGRWLEKRDFFKEKKASLFILDQAVHIAVIFAVACFCATSGNVAYSRVGEYIANIYKGLDLGLPISELIRLICLLLFLWKPVNIILQKIFKDKVYEEQGESKKEQEEEQEKKQKKEQQAGRIIGVLERYLIVILVISQQYTAIGFVIAAKSLTRFEKISKEPNFAEKYLIGTMGSMLLAIVGAILYIYIP